MEKRDFLRAALGVSALSGFEPAYARAAATTDPVLLTISGQVRRPNRGGTDDALDQLMHKHGVAFSRARTFTYAELDRLPSTEIRPVLEYDAKPHTLRGPTLRHLLEIAGAADNERALVTLRAFDGYTVELNLSDIRRLNFIVATRLDGLPMALGGLGPLWAIVDADRIPELAAQPIVARFAQCPWGLYSVHVAESGTTSKR